jgi:hypothetical protein
MPRRHRRHKFHVRYAHAPSDTVLCDMLPYYALHVANCICCLYSFACLMQPRGCAVPSVAPIYDATAAAASYSATASSTVPLSSDVSFQIYDCVPFLWL